MTFLIAGLGNPGKRYEKTRHNIGFEVLKYFAKKYNLSFQKSDKLKGYFAAGMIEEEKVMLLLPTTYMNESGRAIHKCMAYYKVDVDHLLVVVDDADIAFQQMRLKDNSGTGGHRGLESIEDYLKTTSYPRLRMGIGRGDNEKASLVGHVLGGFTSEERKQMPSFLDKACSMIVLWMKEGIQKAKNEANIRKITKPSDKENKE